MDKFEISATLEKAESRDYDKYPIIIKDNSIEMIKLYLPFLFLLDIISYLSPYRHPGELTRRPKELGSCYIKFKNSAIEYFSTKKNLILFKIELSNIVDIKLSLIHISEPTRH